MASSPKRSLTQHKPWQNKSRSNASSFNFTPCLSDNALTFAKLDKKEYQQKESFDFTFGKASGLPKCDTLSSAVASRQLSKLEKVLEKSERPSSWQMDLNAAVVQAMTNRQPSMVQRLLEAGAAVPYQEKRYPPLFTALDMKEFESFQLILKHTPEEVLHNILVTPNDTLLHAAVRSRNIEIVKQVANKFNDLSLSLDTKENAGGLTPLHMAVKWLSTKPPKLEWFSKDKSMKKRKQDKLTDYVKKKKPLGDVYGNRNYTCLEYDTSIVQFLLERGASVNVVGKTGKTPLHDAVVTGCVDLVLFLLDQGADPAAVDNNQYIPWMYAITCHRTSIITLLEERTDLMAHESNGKSLLHLACASGCLQAIKALLRTGMDINSINNDGFTPLMEAVEKHNVDCVRFLVEQPKCDVNQMHNEESALTVALTHLGELTPGGETLLSILKEAGADLNKLNSDGNSLLLNYYNNNPIRTWLLKNGADVNVIGVNGVTCLWKATGLSGSSGTSYVDELMNFNIDMRLADHVTIENGDEMTPFLRAFTLGNHELCTLFLNAGCRGYKVKSWLQTDSGKLFLENMDASLKPVAERIQLHVSQPRGLQDITRQCILACLGSTGQVDDKVSCLPLPRLLKTQMKWPVFLKWKQACYDEGVDA